MVEEGLPLGPMIDGDLITRTTLASLAAGVGADKPLVLGATDDEFSMALADAKNKLRWVPLSLLLGKKSGLTRARRRAYLAANTDVRRRGHAAVLGRLITDRMFGTAVIRTADARGTAPTWVYKYSFRSTTFDFAVHCIDVPFWFDCLDSVKVEDLTGAQPPQQLADETHGAAVALVREGEPGWPTWSETPGTTWVFGSEAGPAVVADGYASVRPLL